MSEDWLVFKDGAKIEIYKDKTGREKIGEDTLKGDRCFLSTYCPQKNDQGEDVRYVAFAINRGKNLIKVVHWKTTIK